MDRAEVTETDVAAMRDGVDRLGSMVHGWSVLIDEIRMARQWVPKNVAGFNRGGKESLEGRLQRAANYALEMEYTAADIQAKIAEVLAVVGAAQAHVEIEVPEVTNKIEKPAEKPFTVLKTWKENGHAGGVDWVDYYVERDYPEGAPNGQGRYQLWKNGDFESKSAPPTDPDYVEIREKIYDTDKGMISVTIRMYTEGDKKIYKEYEGRKLHRTLSEEEGEEIRAEYFKRTKDVKAMLKGPVEADMSALLRRLEVLK
jgi:hypothetical protein